MTDAKLSSLEAAAQAATPGPWESDGEYSVCSPNGFVIPVGTADLAFIAAANPVAILELIAELRQAQSRVNILESYIADEMK